MNICKVIFLFIFISCFWATSVSATTFTVTKTADTNDGICNTDCSLREAMTLANSNPGSDTIDFNITTSDSGYRDFDNSEIPSSGDSIGGDDYWTIRPTTVLPTLSGTTNLDATTQTTNQGNKNSFGPEIEVKGTGTSGINCLYSNSVDTVIKGFTINNCNVGITVQGTNPTVSGNYIGVDPQGSSMISNTTGIDIRYTTNGLIGGLNESDRNIISGNKSQAITFSGNNLSPTSGINVFNNYINVDRTGTNSIIYNYGVTTTWGIYAAYSKSNVHIGNGTIEGRNIINGGNYGIQIQLSSNNWSIRGNYFGIAADGITRLTPVYALAIALDSGAHHNTVGGANVNDRNYIADATFATVWIWDNSNTSSNAILNNYIAANVNGDYIGSTPSYGVMVGSGNTCHDNIIGQAGAGNLIKSKKGVYISGAINTDVIENTITGSTQAGITIQGTGTTVNSNSMYDNNLLGINILGGTQDAYGVTTNDAGDSDAGVNDLQNYPEINRLGISSNNMLLADLDIDFNPLEGPFMIEFYNNDTIDSSGYGEGKTLIGSVTTSIVGSNVILSVPINGSIPTAINKITTIATNANGSTSEFSAISIDGTLYSTLSTGNVTIINGVNYTNTFANTMSLVAEGTFSTVTQMLLSESINFDGASWETYYPTKSLTFSRGDGLKTVYVKFKDAAGNESGIYSDTITLDTTAPTDEITINQGATYTSSINVALTIQAIDTTSNVNQMLLSENSNFTDAGWETYSATKSWTLSSGDGDKRVYVKFKDSAENISEVYSDFIVLDTTTPDTVWTTSTGETRTFSFDSVGDSVVSSVSSDNLYTEDTLPTFSFTRAGDSTSGVDRYQILLQKEGSEGFTMYIDNIYPDKPGSGSDTSDKTREDDERYIYYGDNDMIKVRSKKESDRLTPGAYKFKVRVYDNAGNYQDSPEKILRVRSHSAVFSSLGGDTVFPLTLLMIGEKRNLNITSLDLNTIPKTLSISSLTPTFYGIANSGATIYLELLKERFDPSINSTRKETFLKKETVVNGESRYGINLTTEDGLTPGSYLVHLMAQNDQKDYVELPEFTLKVGAYTSTTSPILGVSDESETPSEDTSHTPTAQPTRTPSRIHKPSSVPTPTLSPKTCILFDLVCW